MRYCVSSLRAFMGFPHETEAEERKCAREHGVRGTLSLSQYLSHEVRECLY